MRLAGAEVGCCCCCGEVLGTVVMGICAVLAIVFAFLSKKNTGKMSGMAVAGLVLGIVAVIMLVLMLFSMIGLSTVFGSMTEEEFIAFFDENLKPYVDEATYEEFINGFKQSFSEQ